MNDFVHTLSDAERKKFRLYAYASTWFGCFSDVMMDSSAVVILYLAMLKSGDSMAMLSTSLVAVASALLMIPASGLVNKIGAHRTVAWSSYIGTSSLLFMAAAPVFGAEYAKYAAFFGCFAYCASKAIWPMGWYVVLGNILLPEERASFLGLLRFSYYAITAAAFWIIGRLMGEKPPLWFLQAVIAAIGVMVMGRTYFISKIRLPEHSGGKLELGRTMRETVSNGSLTGFSAYVAFLCFAYAAVLPLTLIYMKSGLNLGDGFVQEVSAVGLAGMIAAYLLYGKLVAALGMRNLQLVVHAVYIITPAGLFFCGADVPYAGYAATALYVLGSFGYGCFYCYLTQEILALAKPTSISMASAFVQTYQFLGTAASRGLTSFMLGGGMLAAAWTKWDVKFCQFQTLFLFCAGLAAVCLLMLFLLPGMVPNKEDHYNP